MANTLTVLKHQKYTNDVQRLLEKTLLSTELANTRWEANLVNGETFNFQRGIYISFPKLLIFWFVVPLSLPKFY